MSEAPSQDVTEEGPATPGTSQILAANDPAGRGLWYANVYDFVTGYLAPNYIRQLSSDTRWCQEWWRHSEAMARLDALWRSFEAHRVSDNASSMAVWWRDFADPTMSALMHETGVFAQCKGREPDGHLAEPMEGGAFVTKRPPWGMFTDERQIAPAEYAEYDDED